MVRIIAALVVCSFSSQLLADTIRVPGDFKTIQAAIDSAKPGDIVLVSAGQYAERIKLKPGISVRSAGDDSKGLKGLKRAEKTILDGGGKKGMHPGVIMAEGSTFDGFTVTNVGTYDKAVWQEHFDTHGENLSDDHGSVQDEKTISGISIPNVNCKVTNNIVHHNGNVGIAIIGNKNRSPTSIVSGNIAYRNLGSGIGAANFAQPIIQNNICFENLRAGIGCRNSSPLILDNECFKNIRAGIGCREKAKAIMRGNKCFQNRRAGIGIRMQGTAPIVEDNKCFENHMAGIGTRDGAMPILRNNNCYKNLMAGIGCDGSKSIVVDNRCRENKMAGIGVRGGAQVTILRNKCIENKLVAIGVIQKSSATIIDNQLKRTGGVPPIVAVKDGSSALLKKNNIE